MGKNNWKKHALHFISNAYIKNNSKNQRKLIKNGMDRGK